MDHKTIKILITVSILGVFSIFALNYYSYMKAMKLLPNDKGKKIVIENCISCHSIEYFIDKRKTRKGWENSLLWMQKMQGMAPLESEKKAEILDYLSKHLGADE